MSTKSELKEALEGLTYLVDELLDDEILGESIVGVGHILLRKRLYNLRQKLDDAKALSQQPSWAHQALAPEHEPVLVKDEAGNIAVASYTWPDGSSERVSCGLMAWCVSDGKLDHELRKQPTHWRPLSDLAD